MCYINLRLTYSLTYSSGSLPLVNAGFGRHGVSTPASNDTGTALGQDGSDWSRDLATLTFDLGGHGACGWCGSSSIIRIPNLKFVYALPSGWRTMCVSINGPGHIRPFDLETGMRVASKVGNLPSKFRHVRSLGCRIIRYVRDGRMDGQTDGQNQRNGSGIFCSLWDPRGTLESRNSYSWYQQRTCRCGQPSIRRRMRQSCHQGGTWPSSVTRGTWACSRPCLLCDLCTSRCRSPLSAASNMSRSQYTLLTSDLVSTWAVTWILNWLFFSLEHYVRLV